MKIHYPFTLLSMLSVVMFFLLPGCVKNDLEELENNEKKILNQYLNDNNISEDSKTEGGIYFIETTAGTGLTPEKDDYVIIDYVGRYLEDNTIRETSFDSLKIEWSLADSFQYFLYGPAKMIYGYSMPGINEALSLMKEGGRATAILPSEKANYDYKPLAYELRLHKVIEDPARYDDSILNIYVSQNFEDTVRINKKKVWTRVIEPSASQEFFSQGDTMYFNFTGYILDGLGTTPVATRIFDSNAGKPALKYIYGQSKVTSGRILYKSNNLVTGLKLAFDSAQFQEQSKVSVALGYDNAFLKEGLIETTKNYTIIPVYQSVVYDIEVVDISPAQ